MRKIMQRILYAAVSFTLLSCILFLDPAAHAVGDEIPDNISQCSPEESIFSGSSVTCLAIPMEHVADLERVMRTGAPGIPLVQLFSTPRADGAPTLWFSPDQGCDRLNCPIASHNHWRPLASE